MIKANDILAKVEAARLRRDDLMNSMMSLPAERWNDNTTWIYRCHLERNADNLATYVRKLPSAVRNKQAKAVAKATAYVKTLQEEALVVYKH